MRRSAFQRKPSDNRNKVGKTCFLMASGLEYAGAIYCRLIGFFILDPAETLEFALGACDRSMPLSLLVGF